MKKRNREFLTFAYSNSTISEEKFRGFLRELKVYLLKVEKLELEENGKEYLKALFRSVGFQEHKIEAFKKVDLAIENQVFIETKLPKSSEMISNSDFRKKAFAQICYYTKEFGSANLKHLIATDFQNLYLFKTREIQKVDLKYRKSAKTDEVYRELQTLEIPELDFTKVEFSKFQISELEKLEKDLESNFKLKRELTAIYKLLSPQNLLEIDVGKDMNRLDLGFYHELLHIFGVEEKVDSDGIQKILRKRERDAGSILELVFSEKKMEFEEAFELSVIWLNRILFLKLLEARLRFMHPNFPSFMNSKTLPDFRALENLFFEVMAKKKRKAGLEKFSKIPYMNSSLFEKKELEEKFFGIRDLDSNLEMELWENSLLGEGKLKTLEYLFRFLDSYDFGSNKFEEVAKEDRTLIKSSVLGLIFEKVNGYSEGSHYTPSFITQKLAKDSLNSFEGTLSEIRVLDPSVGSGHILVSVLNELVLRGVELPDQFGKSRKLSLENDEIHIADEVQYIEENGVFPAEATRIQVALFQKVKSVIEKNLFGVDINPNSVEIARLRLWVELLKWSYYDENGKFITLPNLDVNVKVGNSLLSQFPLSESLEKIGKEKVLRLQELGKSYFHKSGSEKREIEKEISEIRSSFRKELETGSSEKKGMQKLLESFLTEFEENFVSEFLEIYKPQKPLFSDEKKKGYKKRLKQISDLHEKIEFLEHLPNGFEWRFEFPDVLREDGSFEGFDLIVANPPYIRIQGLDRDISDAYKKIYKSATGNYDIYVLFVERFLELLKPHGNLHFIMPHKWINSGFGKGLRELTKKKISQFISFGEYLVFDNAMTCTSLAMFHKREQETLKYAEFQDSSKKERMEKCRKEKRMETAECEPHLEITEFLETLSEFETISTKKLGSEPWIFKKGGIVEVLEKLEEQPYKVSDVFEKIFTGIQTSGDDIFLLNLDFKSKEILKREKNGEKFPTFKFEEEFLKPILKGNDVHRYEKLQNKYWVIFPYKFVNGKAELYSEEEISEKFPESYKYLKYFEKEFRQRERGRFDIDGKWFQFGRKQGLNGVEIEKLMQPDISFGGNFALDSKQKFFHSTTIYSWVKKKSIETDYKFYLAILNSKVMWFFIRNRGTVLANGYFRFLPSYLNPFPLPAPSPVSEKVLSTLVDFVLFEKEISPKERNTELLESVIDIVVFNLYFEEEMKKADCYILDRLFEKLQPLENFEDLETKREYLKAVENFFNKDSKIKRSLIFSYKLIDEVQIINGK